MEIIWIAAAYILGLGTSYLGLPPLVGYLVGGFILGEWGSGESPTIHIIAETGVLLLLFSVGLKLNLKSLLNWEVLGIGTIHLITIGTGFTLLFLIAEIAPSPAVFLGLGLAFSSTVFAAKALEEKSEIGAFHGRLAIGILIVQDLIAVGMLVVAEGGTFSPWTLFFLFCIPLLRSPLKRILSWSGHSELLLLYGLFIALGGSHTFGAMGLSAELGALVAGMLLADHVRSEELSKTLWGLKEAFLVGFFLQIGLEGLPDLQDSKWLLLLIALLPLKAVLYFFFGTLFRLRARTAFLTAIALFSYSEFLLIVAAVAVKDGILSPTWLPTLALLVTISLIIAAPLNRASHTLFAYFERWLIRFERQVSHPEGDPSNIKQAKWLVIGMGRAGTAAYNLLIQKHQQAWGLDSDPVVIQQHLEERRRVIYGDAEDPDLLEKINVQLLVGVILGIPDLEAKLRFSKRLRQNGFQGMLATMSFYPEEDAKLYKSGVNLIFHPFSESGERLAERALAGIRSVTFEPLLSSRARK
jgi:predicted Kef-type K+ transport protein